MITGVWVHEARGFRVWEFSAACRAVNIGALKILQHSLVGPT